MIDGEDWLKDPLRKIENGSYKRRKLKSPIDDKQNDLWWSFHFATRLKLDGGEHFCRQVLGAASMLYDQGLPLLAHRQLEWYLGAFFFELVSAYDTLLQELNIVYAYDLGLKPEEVKPKKIKGKLPDELVKYVEEERRKDWFCEVQWYRNLTTHHYRIPKTRIRGDDSPDSSHHTFIHYRDKEGNFKSEKISVCKDYLMNMVQHIRSIWEIMKEDFE